LLAPFSTKYTSWITNLKTKLFFIRGTVCAKSW
jgi:hypothetical protein